jgi:hypothetical protein
MAFLPLRRKNDRLDPRSARARIDDPDMAGSWRPVRFALIIKLARFKDPTPGP